MTTHRVGRDVGLVIDLRLHSYKNGFVFLVSTKNHTTTLRLAYVYF